MEAHIEPNLFQLLFEEGPWGLFIVVFSVGCTVWLLGSRIRGCFRAQPTKTVRDLAFLFTGPISSILFSAIKAMVAAQSYVRGGIDAEFPLLYGLSGAIAICSITFLCFVLGVIALMLPAKSRTAAASM